MIHLRHPLRNILLLFSILLITPRLFGETVLLKSGERAYGTVIDQDPESVTIIREGKRERLAKNKILKIVFKEIKDEQEIAKIVENERKKLNKEGKRNEREEQADMIYLEQMIKENSYKIVQKRLALLEKYLEERDGDWERYISAKRNPWEPVWKSALLPGWGQSTMRQGEWSSIYSTLFFASLVAYFALDAAEKDRADAYNKKIFKTFEQKFTLGFLPSGFVPASTLEQYDQIQTIKTLDSLSSIRSDEAQYKNAKHAALGVAAGIYVIQLVHSYFSGKAWAAHNVIETPAGESVREGFGIRGNPLVSKEIAGGIKSIDVGGQILYSVFF